MILILSETTDFTTYKIAKWLEHLGKKVFILTEVDEIDNICILDDNIMITANNNKINISELEAYWFRRGNFKMQHNLIPDMPEVLREDHNREQNSLLELLHAKLLKVPNLGSIFNADLNRVNVIWKAKKCGLNVPHIGIFNTKKELINFENKYKKIIIKPISNGLLFIENNRLCINYTSLFTKRDIEDLPDKFPPALFMEYVEKKYEVRVFYLDGECFSLATFSQGDPKTEIDFRKYNKSKPNRNASYILPEDIAASIKKLMKTLMLNTGSIDIIVTPEDEFVFLEINPVGQFLNVDYLGNYGLAKKIGSYLAAISN